MQMNCVPTPVGSRCRQRFDAVPRWRGSCLTTYTCKHSCWLIEDRHCCYTTLHAAACTGSQHRRGTDAGMLRTGTAVAKHCTQQHVLAHLAEAAGSQHRRASIIRTNPAVTKYCTHLHVLAYLAEAAGSQQAVTPSTLLTGAALCLSLQHAAQHRLCRTGSALTVVGNCSNETKNMR